MTVPVNISVLVPVYNVEPYLVQCLESICSQTLRELEVVCVDDASTDGSLSILREFAERDPPGESGAGPGNGGLSRSRNLAMNHAVGEYLFLVDSDDWLETDLLEESIPVRRRWMPTSWYAGSGIITRPTPTGKTGSCRRIWPLRKRGGFPALRRPLGKYIMEREV